MADEYVSPKQATPTESLSVKATRFEAATFLRQIENRIDGFLEKTPQFTHSLIITRPREQASMEDSLNLSPNEPFIDGVKSRAHYTK